MSIRIKTANPTKLLADFRKAIDEKRIVTWTYDKDGDFTHAVEQWRSKAWLHPRIKSGELVLYILPNTTIRMSKTIYAVYHGRFIESMLTHFDSVIDFATASGLAEAGDVIAAQRT